MAGPGDIQIAAESVMPGVVSIDIAPLQGGSSAFVALLTLRSAEGEQRRVVFRQHADRAVKEHTSLVAAKEFHLTRELANEGLEVAFPLLLHGDGTSIGPWLVTEWVEGSTVVIETDIDAALTQMARFLARLHAVDPAGLSAPGIIEIEDPVVVLPHYVANDDTGRAVQRCLDLGAVRHPNTSVLLHGDFWPGNVMFDRGELVAVLDWEDAKWGDPLADLACARVELTCAYGREACELFTARYRASARSRNVQLDEHDLALWDVYVSATALSAMHRWGLSPQDEAARRGATTRFLDAATGRMAGAG